MLRTAQHPKQSTSSWSEQSATIAVKSEWRLRLERIFNVA
jgi:hypothetical protein